MGDVDLAEAARVDAQAAVVAAESAATAAEGSASSVTTVAAASAASALAASGSAASALISENNIAVVASAINTSETNANDSAVEASGSADAAELSADSANISAVAAAASAVAAAASATGSIDTHSDVDTSSIAASVDDVLRWDGNNWVPGEAAAGGGGSSVVSLDDLSDVDLSGIDDQPFILQLNPDTFNWEVALLPDGGGAQLDAENEWTAPQNFLGGAVYTQRQAYGRRTNTGFNGNSYETSSTIAPTLNSNFSITKLTTQSGVDLALDGLFGGNTLIQSGIRSLDPIHVIMNVSSVRMTLRHISPKNGASLRKFFCPNGTDYILNPGDSVTVLLDGNNNNFWRVLSGVASKDLYTERHTSVMGETINAGVSITAASSLFTNTSEPNTFSGNNLFAGLNRNVNYELQIHNSQWIANNAVGNNFDSVDFLLSVVTSTGATLGSRNVFVPTSASGAAPGQITIPFKFGEAFGTNPGTVINLSVGGLTGTSLAFGPSSVIRLVQVNSIVETVKFE